MRWPDAVPLVTDRLVLEPLRVEHAAEMAPLLDDPALYVFTGGRPAGRVALRRRYERQVRGGSPDGTARWLNWIVRRQADGRALGTVQATVRAGPVASVAWVIAVPFQGQGYAREAAAALAAWLREGGAALTATIHPDHAASGAVARAIGLAPTEERVDGEVRWR